MKNYEDLIQRLRTGTGLPVLQALMNEAADAIEAIPAADVREVVTCGECKHWFPIGSEWRSCDRDALMRHKDFFCAAGERQTNSADMRGESNGT